MVEIEIYKHDNLSELNKHIQYGLNEGKKLMSVYTQDTFWSFSLFNKKSTIAWEIKSIDV